MTKKFVNAIVPVFHANHVTAVLNEAERLGYKHSTDCCTLSNVDKWHEVQAIHLGGDGVVFAYIHFTAPDLLDARQPPLNEAIILNKLRKLRGLDAELNKPEVVTESRDNQASLVVRPKYAVQGSVSGRVRSSTPNLSYSDPYGTVLPTCPNLGLLGHDVKVCNLTRIYGGKCTVIPKDVKDNRVIITLESALLSKLIRGAVLVTSKIVSVVKRSFNMLKGGK